MFKEAITFNRPRAPRSQVKRGVLRTITFRFYGGSLKLQRITSWPITATILIVALACEPDVINGWPRGHALLQGSVLRRGNVPYEGQLFVTCAGHGAGFRTTAPGQYHTELSWSFPEGVPADSLECELRADQPSFAATRRVLFVPQNSPAAAHTLNLLEP